MAEAKYVRKKILINPRLQGRLLRDCCTAPLGALIGGSLVVTFLLNMVQAEAGALEVELPTLQDLVVAMVMFVAVCSVVIFYHAVHFSHRIAGPLYRFGKTIDEIVAGNTDLNVRLRRRDYMHETAEQFNRLIAHLQRQQARIRELEQRASVADRPLDPDAVAAPPFGAEVESEVESVRD